MQRWNPPLPQGWEARWDAGQGRYFFINHYTKATQWNDPRGVPPPAQSRSTAAASAAVASLSPSRNASSSRNASPSPSQQRQQQQQAYQMQDMASRNSQGHSRQSHHHHQQQQHQQQQHHQQQQQQNESSMSEDVDHEVVAKLHGDFPNATRALITDMLVSCYNDERTTREQLNDLGFAANRGSSNNTGRGGGGGASSAASQRQESAGSQELSTLEKNRIHQQMSVAFPTASMEVIEMSMQTVNYDLAKGKMIIERYLEQKKQEKKSSKTTTSGGSEARGSSSTSSTAPPARSHSPSQLEPASISASRTNQPRGLSSGAGQTPTGFVSQIMTGSGSASTSASTSQGRDSQHSNAKKVTKMSEHLLTTTSDLLSHLTSSSSAAGRCCPRGGNREEGVEDNDEKKNQKRQNVPPKRPVVTFQPGAIQRPAVAPPRPPNSVMSPQGSNTACGPDPSLRRGPDSSLLSNDMSMAMGPDTSLRNGPDASLVAGRDRTLVNGALGGSGPDLALRCGPQSSLLHQNQQTVLVTDI